MSILIDSNEPPELDYLLTQMGIEVQRGSYNKTAGSEAMFPDFQVISHGDYIGCNRKQAVEAMADLDKVEDQLRRELVHCGKLVFVYEGCLTFAEEGTYAGDAEYLRVVHHTGRAGNEYDVLASRGRVLSQPYARWTRFIWKLQDAGIPVVATGNLRGTATFLHSLHQAHDNNLFTRLIKVRQQILEDDPAKRILRLFYMGIEGVGEEASLTLAEQFPSMTELVMYLMEGGHIRDLALPSGRRIGPALEKRIRLFLGVEG